MSVRPSVRPSEQMFDALKCGIVHSSVPRPRPSLASIGQREATDGEREERVAARGDREVPRIDGAVAEPRNSSGNARVRHVAVSGLGKERTKEGRKERTTNASERTNERNGLLLFCRIVLLPLLSSPLFFLPPSLPSLSPFQLQCPPTPRPTLPQPRPPRSLQGRRPKDRRRRWRTDGRGRGRREGGSVTPLLVVCFSRSG